MSPVMGQKRTSRMTTVWVGLSNSCDSAQHAEGCLSRPHDDDADLSL